MYVMQVGYLYFFLKRVFLDMLVKFKFYGQIAAAWFLTAEIP